MEWVYDTQLVDYETALKAMQERVDQIYRKQKPELIWCLQHPPLFTAGTSAQKEELLNSFSLPVYYTGRGGRFTYHGPGQLIVYILVNLIERQLDIKAYLNLIENWIIETLQVCGINAEQRAGRIGVWVKNEAEEAKIAAIGIRVSRGVTWHGLAINVAPDLKYFTGVIPCGLSNFGVTSLAKIGAKVNLNQLQEILKTTCPFH